MQSYNEMNQIVHSASFETPEKMKGDLFKEFERARKKGAVSHTVGRIPSNGETVEINGLKYTVKHANIHTGKLNLKLKAPANKRLEKSAADVRKN